MRLAIDGKRYFLNSSGLGRYSRTLVEGLLDLDEFSKDELVLFKPKGSCRFQAPRHSSLSVVEAEYMLPGDLGNALWRFRQLPRLLEGRNIDVFHGPSHVIPTSVTCPAIVTMFDLIFLHFPAYFRMWDRHYYRVSFRRSAARADLIISISESTKADLINFFSVPESKITVVYPSFDPVFQKIDKATFEETRQRLKVPASYILYVGTIEPRKNILRLSQAFDKLVQGRKDLSDLHLLIVGQKGWFYQDILAGISKLGTHERIRFTGPLFEQELAAVYHGARLMAYPSLYEGFGYPVLEAMSVGTPVMTSNVSSLPEAAGDAAILVEPGDIDAIVHGLEILLYDEQRRAALIARGYRHARAFTGQRMARETLDCYRRLL